MKVNKLLKSKMYESIVSVLPITAIVLILSITITPITPSSLILFLFGAIMLIFGMGFFTMGADMAMMPMGEGIGVSVSKFKKVGLSLIFCFVLATLITIAEPDLQVLANQVPAIPNNVLVITVAVGVGIFMVLSQLRMMLKIPLSYTLLFLYAILFILTFFVPDNFIPVSFDSGGVTTGPITVPFIMALGIGMASIRSDKNSNSDSFGLITMCSIGPIMAVMILGIFYEPENALYATAPINDLETTKAVAGEFLHGFPHYLYEVAISLVPIILLFFIFQLVTKRFRKHVLFKIIVGLAYTYFGLVLFLTGVNIGFMPVGENIGKSLATQSNPWILVPIGMIIGYFIVRAEPAVHVLTKQVEEVSNGSISQKAIEYALSIGIAVSVGMSMARIIMGVSIMWFLIPGYSIALILTFFVPQMFTAIAFDSGGVASGPMTATFLLPLAMGACQAVGGNVLTDAFGIVAMVAMTPLVTIQLLGLAGRIKTARIKRNELEATIEDTILYFD